MARILTICPTYNRVKLCKEMIDSWNNTIGDDNTLVLGVDVGDPSISEYPRNVNRVLCKAGSTITEVINSIWAKYQDYDFYHITNDDVIYRTKNWDKNMAFILNEKNGGIAYGNDLFQSNALPTFPFISTNVSRATGWLQHPSLIRYCGDTVWADIGRRCNCLYYFGGIIIEHMHKLAGKGDTDVDMKVFDIDWKSYAKWVSVESIIDSARVREAINDI